MIDKSYVFLTCCILAVFASCNGQHQNAPLQLPEKTFGSLSGVTVPDLGKDISCILQDHSGHYWFASNGTGAYRYDGHTLTHYSEADGLCSNFVIRIEEDPKGDLWFTTRDGFCRFNGVTFRDYTDTIKNATTGKLPHTSGGLFFGHLNGICFYDGNSFTNFSIYPETYHPSPSDMNRPYSIYSTLVDKAGQVWFGTQEKGVCRYDGNSITFFTAHGLDKAAVRTLFQDQSGTIWAGNNGAGLFRFNGSSFENFTEENGLSNHEFLKGLKGKEGTLARPWAINEDTGGHLWIGTIDAGVWKYDGKELTNYTTKDGLAGNSIWAIYKDKNGLLWFVSDGETICRFDGRVFYRHAFQ